MSTTREGLIDKTVAKGTQSFYAFLLLLISITVLTTLTFYARAEDIALIDKTVTGLIAIAGVAANSLFRRDGSIKETTNVMSHIEEEPTVQARGVVSES